MVMYDNNMIMSLKQKERKFEPRIKLNHNIYKKIPTSNRSDTKPSFSSFTWTTRSSVVCRSHTEAKRRPSRKRQRNRCYIRTGDVVDYFEDVWFMVRFLLDQVMSGYFGAIRNNRGPREVCASVIAICYLKTSGRQWNT